ncbi:hypothetical protein EDD86DRAFT_198252 [Gorgonomyces haynaldii]|nr:hypothetical protein EDD86DRAFT_198252 [Gorgonomyces haynaldii]
MRGPLWFAIKASAFVWAVGWIMALVFSADILLLRIFSLAKVLHQLLTLLTSWYCFQHNLLYLIMYTTLFTSGYALFYPLFQVRFLEAFFSKELSVMLSSKPAVGTILFLDLVFHIMVVLIPCALLVIACSVHLACGGTWDEIRTMITDWAFYLHGARKKTFKVTEVYEKTDPTADDCCICLCPFDSSTVKSKVCGHMLHRQCAERWLRSDPNDVPTCPLCKKQLTILIV